MKKLITALSVALFALSGTAAYAADEKKAEPAKSAASAPKAADKPASAAKAADKSASAMPATKKEKKGGC